MGGLILKNTYNILKVIGTERDGKMNNAVAYFEYGDTLHVIDFNASSKEDALKIVLVYTNEFILEMVEILEIDELMEVNESNDIEDIISAFNWINRLGGDFKIRRVEYNGETLFTGYKIIYESR